MNDLFNKRGVIPATVGVITFATGLGIGYILGKRNGDVFVVPAEALEEKWEGVKTEMGLKTGDNRLPEPDPELEALLDEEERISRDYRIVTNERPNPADITVVNQPNEVGVKKRSVFDNVHPDPDFDYEAELATRSDTKPYIIHRDEYFADEFGNSQSSLTYYEGDDILADELDTIIAKPFEVVGELKWGHGSGDPNVVYIRNERLQAEYEVLKATGRYEVIVRGYQIEDEHEERDLKHSVRRFQIKE